MMTDSLIKRFSQKIHKTDNCWIWLGCPTSWGYGQIREGNKYYKAHRLSYLIHKGEIPEGLVVDHLCSNRICVNPDHLEAVTQRTNVLRGIGLTSQNAKKTECHIGHEFSSKNTYVDSKGHRHCKKCRAIHQYKWKYGHDRQTNAAIC